jgi:hypothetical protein
LGDRDAQLGEARSDIAELRSNVSMASADIVETRSNLASARYEYRSLHAEYIRLQEDFRLRELNANSRERELTGQLAAAIDSLNAQAETNANERATSRTDYEEQHASLLEAHKHSLTVTTELNAALQGVHSLQADASRNREQFARELEGHAELVSEHRQCENDRVAATDEHNSQVCALEANALERETNLRLRGESLEAELRTIIEAEQRERLTTRKALDLMTLRLTMIQGSLWYRLSQLGRRRKSVAESNDFSSGTLIKAPQSSSPPYETSSIAAPLSHQLSGSTMEQESISTRAAATTDELLNLFDEPFVHCAYRTIFGREADAGGLRNYLNQVRSGTVKGNIVAELARSPEGQCRANALPGLVELLRVTKLKNRSFFSDLMSSAASKATLTLGIHMRRIENSLGVIASEQSKHAKRVANWCGEVSAQLSDQQNMIERSMLELSTQLQRMEDRTGASTDNKSSPTGEFLTAPAAVDVLPSVGDQRVSKPNTLSPHLSHILNGLTNAIAAKRRT